MWFAYVATPMAFLTGLNTLLVQYLHWLAIAKTFLVAFLPILTMLLGEWLVLNLGFQLGKTYNSGLLSIVLSHQFVLWIFFLGSTIQLICNKYYLVTHIVSSICHERKKNLFFIVVLGSKFLWSAYISPEVNTMGY